MGLRLPSLPLVDVSEQQQRLGLDVVAAERRGGLDHFDQLVGGGLELAEHHRHVRVAQAQLGPEVFVLVVEKVERTCVVAVGLAEALAALGAAACLGEHRCGFPDWRFDWTAGDLAGEQARLFEVPGDDLYEFVCLGRQVAYPIREAEMKLCAASLRYLSVGDVAHQDVVERVLLVVLRPSRPSDAR